MIPLGKNTAVVLLIAVVSVGGLFIACATTKEESMGSGAAAAAAFLPDPSLLQAGQPGQVDRVYLNPSANWGSYTKMILEPVTIWTGRGSDMTKVSPNERKALADGLYMDLRDAASKKCQMVTEPGPGTMRWRIALVDATSTNPFMNTVSTFEPHARLLDLVAGATLHGGVAYFVGQATGEGYAQDAATGMLLWEGQDRRVGTKALQRDTLNSWGDVDNAFKAWAAQLSTRMDQLGVCRRG